MRKHHPVNSRNTFLVAILALLTGVGLALYGQALALDTVKPVPPPKHWDHFVFLVWQYQTNAIRDKALYEEVNMKGFHIDRRNAKLRSFADETHWPFYVDHTADKGYLYLSRGNPAKVKKKRGLIARPNSLADPKTIAAMKAHIQKNINAAKDSTAVGYALDDEISLGSFTTPAEVDASPLSIKGYRKWLEKRYAGKIKKLNAEYGTSFADFGSISPKSFEAFRRSLHPKGIGKINLSQWCDWRSYMDTQFAEVLEGLVRYANTLDPNTPCGFVGGQGPSAWGGYDWRKLCKAVQWCEAYDIGGNNEIIRSFWGQDHALMKTYFSSKDPKKDAWYLWYYLSHGNRGVICWPAGWFKGGKVASYVKAGADTYKEVSGPISKLIINGKFQYDPVAIYYSHPSIQMTWALDSATHGGTWPNRSSSMDGNLSTSNLTRIGWLKTLEDLGVQARFYHKDHLLGGQLQKDGVKVLLLNRVLCLSDEEAAAIKKFAADGGTVIADHLCGIFDGHGKARSKGALDELFGVQHDLSKGILTGKTLTEVDGEKGYRGLTDKNWDGGRAPQYKDAPVFELGLTANGGKAEALKNGAAVVVRKGKAVYLNLSSIGYWRKRAKKTSKAWLPLIAGLLKAAGVSPRVKLTVGGQPADAIEPIFWKNGEKITLCLIRNLGRSYSVTGFGGMQGKLGAGKVKLKLTFAQPVKGLKNERSGKALGDGTAFEDTFTPWEANIYTYTP